MPLIAALIAAAFTAPCQTPTPCQHGIPLDRVQVHNAKPPIEAQNPNALRSRAHSVPLIHACRADPPGTTSLAPTHCYRI